ncbi:chemotaxis protein CheW [Desulforamulus ruminis]|uniref:CheW domain protein n=1 Tax=Desulforamulus ruminis (strain ATCC 23193 / DSM 2154 / NCIMB 8452 / DL) TaxID=696281 RepID=F6DLS9_DESRL|nr:chemotaxis protein CheW [Desulforamulus ruminis]AEG58372.1 CheW domain protein [Desulforamulus ruminis DSM 2154]
MSTNQVIVFELGDIRYCVDILKTQEIMRMVEVTPVNEENDKAKGIINLRNELIPIINTAHLLRLSEQAESNETRIIVVESNKKKVGLIVDRVLEVGTYTLEEMEEMKAVASADTSFIRGIIKKKEHLWLMLNLDQIA